MPTMSSIDASVATSQNIARCWLSRTCSLGMSTPGQSSAAPSLVSPFSLTSARAGFDTVWPHADTTQQRVQTVTTTYTAAAGEATALPGELAQRALVKELYRHRQDGGRSCQACQCLGAVTEALGRPILCTQMNSTDDFEGETVRDAVTTKAATWRLVDCQGLCPEGRFGHTALPYKEYLVAIFGGRGDCGCLNDLWLYDSKAQRWYLETPRRDSPMPAPRSGHAAVLRGDSLYVLGGGGSDDCADPADLWRYRFDTREWLCAEAQISGCPVKGHTLHLLPAEHTGGRANRDLLVCFGGLLRSASRTPSTESAEVRSSTATPPVATRTAHSPTGVTSPATPAVAGVPTTPPPFASTTVGDLVPTNTVMIGRVEAGLVHWKHLRTSGRAPCPRSFHAAEVVRGTTLLVVFGGRTTKSYYTAYMNDPNAVASLSPEHRDRGNVLLNDLYMLNTATGVWQKLTTFANTPPPRSCAASVWGSGRMVLLGGGGRTCDATNYELDTRTRQWRAIRFENQPLASCPTVTPVHGKLIFFGGCGPDKHLRADVLELPLLPLPVKSATAEWLYRMAIDTLLYAESPAVSAVSSKFVKRPGEGRVTLRVNTLTRPYRGDLSAPELQVFHKLQRLHDLADEDESGVPSLPFHLTQTVDADGVVSIGMNYDVANPLHVATFDGAFEAPVPAAVRDTRGAAVSKRGTCTAGEPAAPSLGHRQTVQRYTPVANSLSPSSPAGRGAGFPSDPLSAARDVPVRAATMPGAGGSTHCTPRTPWLADMSRNVARATSASVSVSPDGTPRSGQPSAAGPSFASVGSAASKHSGVLGRGGSSSSLHSTRSTPSSDDSIPYIETAIGRAESTRIVPSGTPATDAVLMACSRGHSARDLRTMPTRPAELVVQSLEGSHGSFLLHKLLRVAQREYQLASKR